MKRSEALDLISRLLEGNNLVTFGCSSILNENQVVEDILAALEEAGMQPKQHVHPRAIEEGLDDPKWGYIKFVDKYPEHHFVKGRPYEYYVQGWEEEE